MKKSMSLCITVKKPSWEIAIFVIFDCKTEFIIYPFMPSSVQISMVQHQVLSMHNEDMNSEKI